MSGSEFANPGLRAFYGHAAGQGRHLKKRLFAGNEEGGQGPPMTELSSHVTGRS